MGGRSVGDGATRKAAGLVSRRPLGLLRLVVVYLESELREGPGRAVLAVKHHEGARLGKGALSPGNGVVPASHRMDHRVAIHGGRGADGGIDGARSHTQARGTGGGRAACGGVRLSGHGQGLLGGNSAYVGDLRLGIGPRPAQASQPIYRPAPLKPPGRVRSWAMDDLVPRPTTGRVFAGTRRVRLADVSPAGRLRLDGAARILQDLSADDTADAALPDAEAWVVRKTVIVVESFPAYLESMALVTWCSGTGSHWAERRISIQGEEGGVIEAATTWVQVNPATGRPVRIAAGFDKIYGEAAGGRRVTARLDHPEAAPADAGAFRWPLRVADFDVLHHVNNAAYWQIVEEALALVRGLRAPLRAEVQHRTAIERGSDVQVATATLAGGGLGVWVVADGRLAATAQVFPG